MNLVYFKSEEGNFGDDLNPWIWDKLFGDSEDYDDDLDFIGIGSILDERLNKENRKKVIFGSGIRDLSFRPTENYDIRFVRGPISARNLNDVPFITDSAYCLALLNEKFSDQDKKYKCSIVPYFRHAKTVNWKLFEKITGIHVILPTKNIEQVLKEIAASEKIIAGAMHGAIIADVLRVPWKRLRLGKHGKETFLTSEIKWHDWLYSINIFEEIQTIDVNSKIFENSKIGNFISGKIQFIESIKKISFKGNFYLSTNEVFEEKIKLLEKEVSKFISDYKK